MILGFLGKGGSGKSSVSTQMALWLHEQEKSVLAVDADHNMDLSYNLSGGSLPAVEYFSQSMDVFEAALSLSPEETYPDAFLREIPTRFTLTPLSPELEKYSVCLENQIRLMVAGPQTEHVLHGAHCSHRLTTPLKILLPLLELGENEVAVVDEKAGADGVSTGIVTGIDVGVIVCEPALHSIKTARQIAELMNFYGTPYVFVGNKVATSEDKDFITSELGEVPITFLLESAAVKRNPSAAVVEWADELQEIYRKASALNQHNRLARTVDKYQRNKQFQAVA